MKVSQYGTFHELWKFQGAVAKTIKSYETGSHEDRHRKGRPRVTSAAEDKFIRVTSLWNRQLTAPQIAAQIIASQSSSNRHISTSTVQSTLRESWSNCCKETTTKETTLWGFTQTTLPLTNWESCWNYTSRTYRSFTLCMLPASNLNLCYLE